ncbi:MAG TPA: AAA family ATPase, partial [Rhodospirillaceae bacterium]|nr:AAA family ATPase [Rhodospirillaceae bacterium]
MPYLAHFGLRDHPFALTPNTDYYYPTQENANIIASLDFALRRDTGIIKIVGEVGTGKTLLCRLLVNKLIDSEAVADINAPQADAGSIVRAVCREFAIDDAAAEDSAYAALNRFLVEEHAKGRMAVVVVDEAQHLGKAGLEAIRLVSNLETETSKLLQIVLFGQTELDDLLQDPSLRQLNQRVVFSFNTQPLTQAEGKRYVAHRIRVSRRDGVEYDIFHDAALAVIAEASGGIPRVINILADKSLLVAFSAGSPTVLRSHALEAIRDTPNLVRNSFSRRISAWFGGLGLKSAAAAAALVMLLAVVGGWAVWHQGRGPTSTAVAVSPPARVAETASPSAANPPPAAVVTAPPAPAAPTPTQPATGPAATPSPPKKVVHHPRRHPHVVHRAAPKPA